MKQIQLMVCDDDFEELMDYYSSRKTSFDLYEERLFEELKKAKVVRKDSLPLNVVSLNSRVLIWNMTKGQTFTIHIVSPEAVKGKEPRFSLYDTLAIALLGYPTGSVIECRLKDGVNRLNILSVNQLDQQLALSCNAE